MEAWGEAFTFRGAGHSFWFKRTPPLIGRSLGPLDFITYRLLLTRIRAKIRTTFRKQKLPSIGRSHARMQAGVHLLQTV